MFPLYHDFTIFLKFFVHLDLLPSSLFKVQKTEKPVIFSLLKTFPREPYSESPATWDELKTKLEAVERKSWNSTFSRIKERRSMFSKQKGSLSLPVSVSHSER